LEKATGETWTVEHVATADEVAAGKTMLESGNAFGVFKLVQASFWGKLPGMRQNFEVDEKEDLVNDMLGINKKSVQAVVKQVLVEQA
jgi:hypothetical protein